MKLNAYDRKLIKETAQLLKSKATSRQVYYAYLFVKGLTREKAPADAGTSTEAAPKH